MSSTGSSALIHMPPVPSMSWAARRIVGCASHLRMCMEHPERSAWFDHHVFEVETLLREYASDYIAQACQDLDHLAWLSRERAAGRGRACAQEKATADAQAKRASAVAFSSTLARGGFCQAGVVAPPDSLMCETNASTGRR